MSTTQYLTDVSVRRQLFLQMFSNGLTKDAEKILNRLRKSLIAEVAVDNQLRVGRALTLLSDLDDIFISFDADLKKLIISEQMELMGDEVDFSMSSYSKGTVNVDWVRPNDLQLVQAFSIGASGADVSDSVEDLLTTYSNRVKVGVRATISDGILKGDSTPQIARQLSGTLNSLNRRQLRAVVTTVTNNTSSMVKNAVYEANDDIMDGYTWLSTLDGSTTLICADRDLKVYKVKQGPMPSAHVGCRSTTMPNVKREYDIGADLDGGRFARKPNGDRTSVSAKLTYGGWLKTQPKEVVDGALGVERSKLFRSGKFKINQFVNDQGQTRTLKELRESENLLTM